MLPEKIKVSVTWDDINNGIPCCSKNCMLAKAVKRALIDTDFKLILVGRNWIYIKHSDEEYPRGSYGIPTRAFHKARMFDRSRGKIEPFNFVMTKDNT